MLEKIIELVKAQRSLRRLGIFFLAFAASLTVMGSSHDVFYGSGSQMAPEKATTASSSGAEAARKDETSKPVVYAHAESGLTEGLMPMVTATQLEEIITTAVADKDEKESPKVKSEDEEDADDEADSVKKGTKSESKVKDTEKSEDKEAEEDSETSGFVYSDQIPMSRELQKYTYEKCEERGLEYELVLAIIWRESRFKVDAVNVNTNGTRDNGIMQINDVNRKWLRDNYGITDLMDPYQNIDAGTAMLGRLTSKYGSHNAMMAYQYGEGGMAKKLKQGITTSPAIEQAYKQRDYYRKII